MFLIVAVILPHIRLCRTHADAICDSSGRIKPEPQRTKRRELFRACIYIGLGITMKTFRNTQDKAIELNVEQLHFASNFHSLVLLNMLFYWFPLLA